MEIRLDLHCHSIASDGAQTIPQLAEIAKRQGLSALVLTDHANARHSYYQNATVRDTLLTAGLMPDIPIILGAEIGTPYGEFLIFGAKVIEQWYLYRRRLHKLYEMFGMNAYFDAFHEYVLHSRETIKIVKGGKKTDHDKQPLTATRRICKLPYAMFIPHPMDDVEYYDQWPDMLYGMLHGFEIINGMKDYNWHNPEAVKLLKIKIRRPWLLRNSDCHDGDVGHVYNTFDFPNGKDINEGNIISMLQKKQKG